MTFLTEMVTRSIENPSYALTDSRLLQLFGGEPTQAGIQVSPEKALRLSTAFRGTQIIASACGGLPLKVYRRADREEVTNSVVTNDESATSLERWETTIAHMVLQGAGTLFKHRDRRGAIRAMTPIHPSLVYVERVKTNDPARPYRRIFTVDGKTGLSDYEVLYIPFMSLDGVTGLGPISYARETFGTALAGEQVAAKLFSQGLLVDGILTTKSDLSKKQARALKARWKAMTQGVANAHDIAVLDNDAKFQPIGMPAKDAQFLEQRKFSRSDIAGLLGLYGWMLNDQSKSTSWGTGMEQQWNTVVTLTFQAYLRRIEQAINREILPKSQYAEFKVEGLLRGDSAARAAFYASGIQHGWLVPNDVRPLENLNPVDWGDVPYRPFNKSANEPDDPQQLPQEDSNDNVDE